MRINLDSPILNFLSKAWDVLVTSVMFVLSCLPIITIGAAATAMHATIMSICNDTCGGVWKKYTGTFISEFKQTTKIWLIFLLALLVLVGDLLACINYPKADGFLSFMEGITVFFTGFYILMFTYTFAIVSRYMVTWKQALRNALYLITKYPPTAILVLLINAAHIFCYWLAMLMALPITPFLLFFQEALLNRIINKEQGVVKEKKKKKSEYETYDD